MIPEIRPDYGTEAASSFYAIAGISMLASWLLMSLAEGRDFHSRAQKYYAGTRPSWLPKTIFIALQMPSVSLLLYHGVAYTLILASWLPGLRMVRIFTAVIFSLYSLAESSVTNSHRDYANMYACWSLAILPLDQISIIRGAALGTCIFLISGSGWSKVLIGGARGWSNGDTLYTVIRHYSRFTVAETGPALPFLSEMLLTPRMRPAVAMLSVLTLFFETLIVPLSLLLPSSLRFTMVLASLSMHVGIAAVQSFIIGMAFVPNIACYTLGFGGFFRFEGEGQDGLEPGLGDGWFVAVALVFALSLGTLFCTLALLRSKSNANSKAMANSTVSVRLLPENWPCTPFALFAWNGLQWRELFMRFSSGNSRLVLLTAVPSMGSGNGGRDETGILGVPLLHHCGPSYRDTLEAKTVRLHDFWELGIGETFAHSELLERYRWGAKQKVDREWDAQQFVHDVADWLKKERRLVDLVSGEYLSEAAFVKVHSRDGTFVVAEVLAASYSLKN